MKIVIAARKSDLARVQALFVGAQLKKAQPDLEIQYAFRESLGDKNLSDPLWKSPTKGVFTEDFITDLAEGRCDLVVHSWKDLPTEPRLATYVAATLKRADPRDVLLVKKSSWKDATAKTLTIYSSSPRREYNLKPFLSWALPRPLEIQFEPVRGNVQTRVRKLLTDSKVDALVVAKAALDRLLDSSMLDSKDASEFSETKSFLQDSLLRCHVMVLPLSADPGAAAQGALALEIRKKDARLLSLVKKIQCEDTFESCNSERNILKGYGGGCHQKIGIFECRLANGLKFRSLKGFTDSGEVLDSKAILEQKPATMFRESESFPQSGVDAPFFERKELKVSRPHGAAHFWIARADALPQDWVLTSQDCVWASGLETWRKLAKRGIWVNGCSESLGEGFGIDVDFLLGRQKFLKLSHDRSGEILKTFGISSSMPELATYSLVPNEGKKLPDLRQFRNFFWMSASAFMRAIELFPEIAHSGQHASGPGHTAAVVQAVLSQKKGSKAKYFSFLGLRDWRKKTIKEA